MTTRIMVIDDEPLICTLLEYQLGGAGYAVTAFQRGQEALLRLVDTGRCWVKLSAPYETSKTGAPGYEDVSRLARALVRHAPERMLWASNWPHPSAPPDAVPDDADLLDLLLDWAPDEATRRRILTDNPAELYGFA